MAGRFKVVLMQYRLLHYRVQLFEQLRASCDAHGIDLVLVHGQPTKTEAVRKDVGQLDWAIAVENKGFRLGGKDILWQPCPDAVKGADLIIFMQENRLLSNYPWLFGFGADKTRVAYWGHGRNFQSVVQTGLREKWKSWLLKKVDWWFAYTDMTRDIVEEVGYPSERITVLNNAIDNAGFVRDLAGVNDAEVMALRHSIGAQANSIVGLFCGSLYPEKRLDLLVEACARVVAERPEFRVVVIGDGPSRGVLADAEKQGWLTCVGAKRGHEKAAWFKAAQLYLNPGLVGLHVLDSFVAGTPMITTNDALHSPEVVYLQHDHNGLITQGNAQSYADAVLSLLNDPSYFARLQKNALASAEKYTLDEMVRRFTEGMVACLKQSRI
jgi:glycosyltransferase involved in cell wall biosynthesis